MIIITQKDIIMTKCRIYEIVNQNYEMKNEIMIKVQIMTFMRS